MSYPVPDLQFGNFHRVEQSIKRSRFIASFGHVASAEEAKAFIDSIRQSSVGATRNCWAFVAGQPGDSNKVGYSDDGEPHGTAGRPMLSILLHCGIGEIVAVVTRYFGGIKLGTGGLVHAYQGIVRAGLEKIPLRERYSKILLKVVLEYPNLEAARQILEQFRGEVVSESFTANVTSQVLLPETALSEFSAQLNTLTNGKVLIAPISA